MCSIPVVKLFWEMKFVVRPSDSFVTGNLKDKYKELLSQYLLTRNSTHFNTLAITVKGIFRIICL
jgi:hypothetical protein